MRGDHGFQASPPATCRELADDETGPFPSTAQVSGAPSGGERPALVTLHSAAATGGARSRVSHPPRPVRRSRPRPVRATPRGTRSRVRRRLTTAGRGMSDSRCRLSGSARDAELTPASSPAGAAAQGRAASSCPAREHRCKLPLRTDPRQERPRPRVTSRGVCIRFPGTRVAGKRDSARNS